MNFHPASPILRVGDLNRSLAYYTEKLGFKEDWRWKDWVASVSRGSCNLMLSQGDQGHPGSWVWIGVGDVHALHEEYARSGATIRQPPTNHAWALEMQVFDPDGNVLRFGSEPIADEPLGSWLDMEGNLWPATTG